MSLEDPILNFDLRFEDLRELQRLTRRGFLGSLLGGAAAGAAFLSFGAKAFALPVPSLNGPGTGAAVGDGRRKSRHAPDSQHGNDRRQPVSAAAVLVLQEQLPVFQARREHLFFRDGRE